MSYNPNMSPEEVARIDAKRGRGQGADDPASDQDPSHEITKKGSEMTNFLDLLKSDNDSDVGPEGEEFGKPLPAQKKREDESEFEHKIRQWSEEVEDRPKRFPGGKDQAVAIAAEQAGVAKKSQGEAGSVIFAPHVNVTISPYEVESEGIDSGGEEYGDEVEKALNSKSMYIPRPLNDYDPFSVYRSATTVTNKSHTRLRGAEGVAPNVVETMREIAGKERKPEMYKSCPAHGLIFKSDTNCRACDIQKAYMCKACGGPMAKKIGGMLSCPTCG
jgi:hypothetical protein